LINFLAELAERFETIVLPTPSNAHHGSATNAGNRGAVYELDISEPPASGYWLDWGGWFDNFSGTQLMLYYEGFLNPVLNMASMRATLNSIFIQGRAVFINLPRHPWLFADYSTSAERAVPYLAMPLNPSNPSDNAIRDVRAQTRLEIPNFTVRISDGIAGITLNQGFSITLINNDGFFDDEHLNNRFNTPVYLKKCAVENPKYEDFKTIRNGLIENKQTCFDKIIVGVADRFKALEEPVCKTIGDDWGFEINDNALNRNVPLVYGRKRINLTKLDETRYMTAGNATGIDKVWDRQGYVVPNDAFSFDAATGILTMNAAGEDSEHGYRPHEALVVGDQNNRIGEIVRDVLIGAAEMADTDSNFNVQEFNRYVNNSPRINLAITGGNIRGAVEDALKSDVAFFIQQTDGRFTVRTYDDRGLYPAHEIPSEKITQRPERDYAKAQENYFSSCVINYVNDDSEEISFLFNEREHEAENVYRRRLRRTFCTSLTNERDARSLAETLGERYTNMRQVVKLAVGVNTADFQLLDGVNVDLTINGRKFSNPANYIITGINHSQDILTLEEVHVGEAIRITVANIGAAHIGREMSVRIAERGNVSNNIAEIPYDWITGDVFSAVPVYFGTDEPFNAPGVYIVTVFIAGRVLGRPMPIFAQQFNDFSIRAGNQYLELGN